MIETEYYIRK